ncbi:unnamed protein product [Rhizoctonia solani]|uniref:Uncharacterized protein n=1 Tax=Rhizoctonia solani TaxID=456999 RepID=A0A8H2WUB8_9AGAM|nr:unnamed protein product [Rhizoctonia solani]
MLPTAGAQGHKQALPATSFATERSRSRTPRRNHPAAQGIHLTGHTLKVPSRTAQPGHGTRHQPRYSYTPADQSQNHTIPQNWKGQERSGRDQLKRQVCDRERPAPVNDAPRSPTRHAVAMVFVPHQPAKRAIAFESSLFQRDDPAVAPPQPCQRMPLSELNILLPNRPLGTTGAPKSPPPEYTPHRTMYPRKSTRELSEGSRTSSTPRPLSPLPSTPSRLMRPSEHYVHPREKEREIFERISSQARRLSRATPLPTRLTRE